jgi:hypothetical protein
MGNYIADNVAGHRESKVRHLVRSLDIVEIPLSTIKEQLANFTPVKIHQYYEGPDETYFVGPSFEGSAAKLQEHISKSRYH